MMNHNPSPAEQTTHSPPDTGRESFAPPLKLDPDQYREYLTDFDLTEDQENELLEVLWNIMRGFVDMAWGIDPVQLVSAMVKNAMDEKAGADSGHPLCEEEAATLFNQVAASEAEAVETDQKEDK